MVASRQERRLRGLKSRRYYLDTASKGISEAQISSAAHILKNHSGLADKS
jgi:hypothetical protein